MSDQNINKNKENTFAIIAQYIKDVSFENITPAIEIASSKQPQIDANVSVDIKEVNKEENTYNVALIVNIQAKIEDKTMFILDLNYAGRFVVSGFAQNIKDIILSVECPHLLFPFARSIVAQITSDGGFPPLFLAPVNFGELYQQQLDAKGKTLQ